MVNAAPAMTTAVSYHAVQQLFPDRRPVFPLVAALLVGDSPVHCPVVPEPWAWSRRSPLPRSHHFRHVAGPAFTGGSAVFRSQEAPFYLRLRSLMPPSLAGPSGGRTRVPYESDTDIARRHTARL